jgi:purine-binding chemotaxis protein CheW
MVSETTTVEAVQPQRQALRQILTFSLNGQDYGFDLLQVQEIRGLTSITPVPNMPPHIKGVMNLRGSVLPVVDLRLKFEMPLIEYTKFNVIVIAHAAGKSVGLVVDSVSDVLNVPAESIQRAPDFGGSVDSRMVQGLLKTSDRLAVLLDLEKLLTESEILAAAVETAPEALP